MSLLKKYYLYHARDDQSKILSKFVFLFLLSGIKECKMHKEHYCELAQNKLVNCYLFVVVYNRQWFGCRHELATLETHIHKNNLKKKKREINMYGGRRLGTLCTCPL